MYEKKTINIQEKENALDFLLNEYNISGFGTLNKSDIDLLIFSIFMKYGNAEKMNDFELSKILKITPQRIRNLKLKYYLKFENETTDVQLLKEIDSSVKSLTFEKEGK